MVGSVLARSGAGRNGAMRIFVDMRTLRVTAAIVVMTDNGSSHGTSGWKWNSPNG